MVRKTSRKTKMKNQKVKEVEAVKVSILAVLADWLQDETANVDPYHDGTLESAIKYAKAEVKQEIGSLLGEILEMDVEQLERAYMIVGKPKNELPF